MKKGEKMSEETKLKLSLAKKGKGNGRLGYKHTPETLLKMSLSAKGTKRPYRKVGTYKHSEETLKKMSIIQTGKFKELSRRWIKDRTKVKTYHNKKSDILYKEWSLNVKKRDNWKCCISNNDCKGILESHHILNWVEYPELRYVVSNGITLCYKHHPRKRSDELKLSPYFMEIVKNK